MNNKRKEFEEKLEKANLSEEQKARYRQLNMQILRLHIMNGTVKVSKWAENIKPLVMFDGEEAKVILGGATDNAHKMVVKEVPYDENILSSLMTGTALLEPLKCALNAVCCFAAYLPNSKNDPHLPELSSLNVLGLIPENVAVGQAKYFEVRLNSANPEEAYDDILQAHKVKIILYTPAYNILKRLRARQRQLPSASKDENQKEQSAPIVRRKPSKDDKQKKNPCRDVPQRQC